MPDRGQPGGDRRRPTVLLDCDPGHDDALALVVAARHCDLVGVTTVAGNAPLSVRQAKKSIHFSLQMDIRTALRFEIEAYNHLVGTEDRIEGIRSFNEKRRPVFKGR